MKTLMLALVASLGCSAFAADPAKTAADPKMQESMNAWMAYATPGEVHKELGALAGKWNYTTKMWTTANSVPEQSKGSTSFKTILGGRYLQQEMKGVAMGQKFEGFGIVGYDNIKGKYESVWLDTMGTGMMKGQGTYEANSKTFTDSGEFSDPTSANKTRTYRTEWKIVSKKETVFSMFGKGEDGKEFKQMEITYKR